MRPMRILLMISSSSMSIILIPLRALLARIRLLRIRSKSWLYRRISCRTTMFSDRPSSSLCFAYFDIVEYWSLSSRTQATSLTSTKLMSKLLGNFFSMLLVWSRIIPFSRTLRSLFDLFQKQRRASLDRLWLAFALCLTCRGSVMSMVSNIVCISW